MQANLPLIGLSYLWGKGLGVMGWISNLLGSWNMFCRLTTLSELYLSEATTNTFRAIMSCPITSKLNMENQGAAKPPFLDISPSVRSWPSVWN